MFLETVVAALPGACLVRGSGARQVRRVTDRDADVGADDVFVAVKGDNFDGHRCVPNVRGAAVIVDRDVVAPEGVAVVRVPNTRLALAPASAAALEWPGRKVPTVAVTGTNGKTTTTFLLAAIARAAGLVPGIIGTTGNYVGDGTHQSDASRGPRPPGADAHRQGGVVRPGGLQHRPGVVAV